MYIFTATVIRNPGTSTAMCYINVNGSNKILAYASNDNTRSIYPSGSGTLVIHLNAGDEVYLSSCTGTYVYSQSSFSGVLVQPDAN